MKKGDRIRMMGDGRCLRRRPRRRVHPEADRGGEARAREIGFLTGSIKEVADTRIGDTITDDRKPAAAALPGFRPAQPVVFCGIFPVDAAGVRGSPRGDGQASAERRQLLLRDGDLRRARLRLPLRFLGLLHLEIIQERLEREFNLDLIATAPSVIYRMKLTDGSEIEIHNPVDMPDVVKISEILEPWIEATGAHSRRVPRLGDKTLPGPARRAEGLTYVGSRALVKYDLPLNEVVFDFYDRLKSVSKGYASFDYHLTDYKPADLVKMQILVNGEPVDALSMLVHRSRAETRGRGMVEKLKELIPPHMFVVPIQAAIGGKIIARETVRALRKDVTAKCYGGDATRKRKLLEKQKEGKKKMRQFGKVDIPQEAFIAALKIDE